LQISQAERTARIFAVSNRDRFGPPNLLEKFIWTLNEIMTVPQLKPLLCVLVFLAMPLTSFGQTIPFLDQTFDFEDLSTAGFTSGIEGPVVVTDSIGNNVLQLQTSGAPSGAGSVLVALNNTLTGDFSDAGSIQFDATNPNLTDLNVRFSFSSPGNVQAGSPSPRVLLRLRSRWQTLVKSEF